MGIQTSRWEVRRLALEGLVVLVSILIAFALDAGWDGRQKARELSQDLEGVRSEMARNRELVRTEVDALQRILDGSAAMLAALESEPAREDVVVVDTLAFLVSNWAPTLDLSFGALTALLESGRLGDIDDLALRTGLAGLEERAVDMVEDERVARDFLNDHLFPLIARQVELGELARLDLEFFSVEDRVGEPIPSYSDVTYPNSLEIRNAIRFRTAWLGSALSELLRLADHVDDLSALLGVRY